MKKEKLKYAFAENLKFLLQHNGYSQQKFVDAFNQKYGTKFTQQSISEWVNAKKMPRSVTVEQISDFFGYDALYMLSEHFQDDKEETSIELNQTFAERLKSLMYENNMRQQDLIDALKRNYGISVNQGTVSSWVTANKLPRYDTLERIGNLFGRDASYMLSKEESKTSDNLIEQVKSADSKHKEIIQKVLQTSIEDLDLLQLYIDTLNR